MKARTKEIIKDGFASLVNNAAAIRGAKAGPLWLTIVMFFLAIFLPIIPLFVAQAKTNGSSFLSSHSYGLERYVTQMAMDLKDKDAKFEIKDHLLSISEGSTEIKYTDYGTIAPYATYENAVTHQYDFMLYIDGSLTNAEKSESVKAYNAKFYELGTTTVSTLSDGAYCPSYMVLFPNGVYVVVFANNGTKAVTYSYNGDFKTMADGSDYLDQLLTVKDKEGNTITPSIIDANYTEGVYKNFKKFLDKSYETLKVKNTWLSSAIYLGIFFGLNVIMGFLMWLLTRGKNNPNNYYTPWLTEKVQARLALAPALITLIVGFFLTSQTMLIYIITIGMRVMWLSMKELRPIQQ